MKRIVVFFIFLSLYSSVIAQVAKPLQFKEEVYDFGQILEKDGPVTHQFEFTNLYNRPVKILNVKPSCGCTTPDWTKEPILPGKTGFIQARFDPHGRPGFFNKSLTVTTDADGNTLLLQIKGTVSSATTEIIAADFTESIGNWKVKSSSFNLGKIYLKDEFVAREFEVYNAGSKPISYLNKVDAPAYIKVNVEPKTLAPGTKGTVRLSYNGKLKNMYGFQSDNIVLHTDDDKQPAKPMTVYATLEDFFPTLTPAESAKAPKLRVSETAFDFGRVVQNKESMKSFTVTNFGKSSLEIRSIQGNCMCIKTESGKKVVKPGESTIVKVFFNPEDRKGTQQKAVTIYSNDPQNPVQRVTFTAYVED